MKIIINGIEKNIANTPDLSDIISQFCKQSKAVIAEVNGEIIKNPYWSQKRIQEGDTIELISFVGGG